MRVLVADKTIESRETLALRVEEALRQAGLRRAELIKVDPVAMASQLAHEPPIACFIGPACYDSLESTLANVQAVFPKVSIALVLSNELYAQEAIELRRTLKARIIPLADLGQMAQFVLDSEQAVASKSQMLNRGVLSVAQCKGGVGASSLCLALATCWLEHGLKVAVVDLDDLSPMISNWAGVSSSKRSLIAEQLRSGAAQGNVLELVQHVDYYGENLGILAQPENYSDAFHFKADILDGAPSSSVFMENVLRGLKEFYDIVVIDLGRSWGVAAFSALTCSDKVAFVVDDDRSSLSVSLENLARLYRESEDSSEFDLSQWSVVLNAHTSYSMKELEFISRVKDSSLFEINNSNFIIPYSAQGKEWIGSEKSLYDLAESKVRRKIEELAYHLLPYKRREPVLNLLPRLGKRSG